MSNTVNLKIFQKTFDSYFWKWYGVVGILYVSIFGTYTAVAFGILTSESELPPFLYRLIAPLEYSEWAGDIPIGGKQIGFLTFGAMSVGAVSIGAFSVGIVSVGAFSIGVFAFGGNSLGIIAIGGGTSFGCFAGAAKTSGRFDIGKALGVFAVAPETYGVYTLSYNGGGTYSLSPSRADAEAVAFFCRWLPKFKKTFHSPA